MDKLFEIQLDWDSVLNFLLIGLASYTWLILLKFVTKFYIDTYIKNEKKKLSTNKRFITSFAFSLFANLFDALIFVNIINTDNETELFIAISIFSFFYSVYQHYLLLKGINKEIIILLITLIIITIVLSFILLLVIICCMSFLKLNSSIETPAALA